MSKLETPVAAEPKYRKPTLRDIGATVHFFDQTRDRSQMGIGPYAAVIVQIRPTGIFLVVTAPYGKLDSDGVPHKSDLDPKDMGRKKWWNWPSETPLK